MPQLRQYSRRPPGKQRPRLNPVTRGRQIYVAVWAGSMGYGPFREQTGFATVADLGLRADACDHARTVTFMIILHS